jgi:hypothetical protein
MRRISASAITHNRCLWKADQIVKSVEVYIRNGGYQDFRRGDFSKVEEAYRKLVKLRFTALSKAEYESFHNKIWALIKAETKVQRVPGSRQEVGNLVSTVEAARYKKHLKAGKRSMDPANRLWVKDET